MDYRFRISISVLIIQTFVTGLEIHLQDDYRIKTPATYFVAVPKSVRPDQEVQIYISILSMRSPEFVVTSSIRKEAHEYTSLTETFTEPSTRLAVMKMPSNAQSGNYVLTVSGYTNAFGRGRVFHNETRLDFRQKHVSVFIQTDNWLYRKNSPVRYRVLAYTPNLMPVPDGSVDIYIKNVRGLIVRRYLYQQLRNGFHEGEFEYKHPLIHGWWTIEVHGWGEIYTHKFESIASFPELYDVNITLPDHVFSDEFAVGGLVCSNYSFNGLPIHGNMTLELEILPPGDQNTNYRPKINHTVNVFTGRVSFMFLMEDIKKYTPVLAGTKLILHATVWNWKALEEKYANAHSVIVTSRYKLRIVGGNIRTFKPGAVLPVYVAIYTRDGSPYSKRTENTITISNSVQKQSGQLVLLESKQFIIPSDSVVKYHYETHADDDRIIITAFHGSHNAESEQLVATRHYTESRHYITVSSSTPKPEANQYVIFTVKTSTYMPLLRYLIKSKGEILLADTLYMRNSQKTFSVAASRDMVPEATILVWGLLHGGEILADSLSFHVHGVQHDRVDLTVNYGKDFSMDTVEVSATVDPSSFVTYSVRDFEMARKGAVDFLSLYKVEEDLLGYTTGTNNSYKHTWYGEEGVRENIYFTAPSSAIDANETFQYAGMTVFTDGDLVRIPGAKACNISMKLSPCYDGNCYTAEQRCDTVWHCAGGADEIGCPDALDIIERDTRDDIYTIWPHYDDASWGWKGKWSMPTTGKTHRKDWDIEGRDEDSSAIVTLTVPLRPTTWYIQAVSLSAVNGLQFNEIPARIETTRPFYVTIEAQGTCVRGEQLGIQVALYNYFQQPLETLLTLADSDDYRFVRVEDFGRVSSYSPRTTRGDVQIMIQLPVGHVRLVHFPILPIVMGKFKVTIIASSIVRRQVLTKEITVKWNGVTNYYHTPYLIDLVNSGSVYIPHLYVAVPQVFVSPGRRENLYVPGSGKATLSLSGDVVGPGFTSINLELYNVFNKMRSGDAFDFLTNLGLKMYWARYLDKINKLDAGTQTRVLEAMVVDLQRVYAYIQPDGGQAIRRKSASSVWLTALALDIISKTHNREWEDRLFVDETVMANMTKWLLKHQNQQDGSFNEITTEYEHKMRSRVVADNGDSLNVTLTAFVIIGLESSGHILTGESQSQALRAMERASQFVADHFYDLTRAFDICLATYALHVAKHNIRSDAASRMRDTARKDNYMYWSDEPVPREGSTIIDNIPYLRPRPLPSHYSSSAIHGTAYALMVYVINNRLDEAVPIVQWLQTQRNFDNGFDGPQDTIAALQALSMFGEQETNREFYTMDVLLASSSSSEWLQQIRMSRGDVNGYATSSIPNVWGSISSKAEGTGYALLQMTTEVNVEFPWQMRKPTVRSFDLEVERLHFYGRNASLFEMNICFRWTGTQYSNRSGQTVLQVDIPTGYFVRKSLLRKYQRTDRIHSERSQFSKQQAIMHIDSVDTEGGCLYFRGKRWYPVANGSIQHFIRIQDKSEPAFFNSTLYTTYGLFHLHICQVCGSFQCPYCPHYNQGARLLVDIYLIGVFVLFGFTMKCRTMCY